jgi:hypothetical protein
MNLAGTMQKTFNAKAPRCKGAKNLKILTASHGPNPLVMAAAFLSKTGVFSKSIFRAPVLGRSNVQTTRPWAIKETAVHKSVAAAEDGRAPYFENPPWRKKQRW